MRDNWKLIHYYEDDRRELYFLSEDIGEQRDVAGKFPDIVKELGNRLRAWLSETEANMPVPNPRFSEAAAANQRERIRNRDLPNLERAAAKVLEEGWSPNPTWWGSKGIISGK